MFTASLGRLLLSIKSWISMIIKLNFILLLKKSSFWTLPQETQHSLTLKHRHLVLVWPFSKLLFYKTLKISILSIPGQSTYHFFKKDWEFWSRNIHYSKSTYLNCLRSKLSKDILVENYGQSWKAILKK